MLAYVLIAIEFRARAFTMFSLKFKLCVVFAAVGALILSAAVSNAETIEYACTQEISDQRNLPQNHRSVYTKKQEQRDTNWISRSFSGKHSNDILVLDLLELFYRK